MTGLPSCPRPPAEEKGRYSAEPPTERWRLFRDAGCFNYPHQKSLSLWQMETITEHPSWIQCRNQWIVGSPAPNGYIYITSARATDSNKTPTPGMKVPLSCWSGVFKGFSKHYKLLLLSLVAPRGGGSAPCLGDSHAPQIQDPEDLSRI